MLFNLVRHLFIFGTQNKIFLIKSESWMQLSNEPNHMAVSSVHLGVWFWSRQSPDTPVSNYSPLDITCTFV